MLLFLLLFVLLLPKTLAWDNLDIPTCSVSVNKKLIDVGPEVVHYYLHTVAREADPLYFTSLLSFPGYTIYETPRSKVVIHLCFTMDPSLNTSELQQLAWDRMQWRDTNVRALTFWNS